MGVSNQGIKKVRREVSEDHAGLGPRGASRSSKRERVRESHVEADTGEDAGYKYVR